ncbi:SIMPL domain-containing protein [Pseudomonas sp. CR3202]|uniref:SIMPL domain-containing protein n=1 Tax=Pseudomonas sp. CR3202 TaxID=3351532 RepID=UPI003BF0D347
MPKFTRLAATLALCAASLGSLAAQAADEVHYNQVAVRAEVSQEVTHDLMHVTLYSESQNPDPAKLADEITRALNSAVQKARKAKGVTVSLGSRNSYPVYDEKGQKITAWRERGELRLESADFATLSQLSVDLLGELKMAGMNFSIAEKTRKTHEDDLLKQAVDAFKARAQLATDALGGKSYKLVNLNLNSAGFQPPQPIMMRAMAAKGYADAAAVPEIEAGTSRVSVSADGTIEVQMP